VSDLPAVGIAPEWMSEKALSIGTYAAASGAYVLFGVESPYEFSEEVSNLISEGWEDMMGGKMEFLADPKEIVRRSLEHIDKKRAELKLPAYDPAKYGQSGDFPIRDYLELPVEEQQTLLYGVPA
jgi:carbon-monoxide dehydrogenase catalytic subunit